MHHLPDKYFLIGISKNRMVRKEISSCNKTPDTITSMSSVPDGFSVVR